MKDADPTSKNSSPPSNPSLENTTVPQQGKDKSLNINNKNYKNKNQAPNGPEKEKFEDKKKTKKIQKKKEGSHLSDGKAKEDVLVLVEQRQEREAEPPKATIMTKVTKDDNKDSDRAMATDADTDTVTVTVTTTADTVDTPKTVKTNKTSNNIPGQDQDTSKSTAKNQNVQLHDNQAQNQDQAQGQELGKEREQGPHTKNALLVATGLDVTNNFQGKIIQQKKMEEDTVLFGDIGAEPGHGNGDRNVDMDVDTDPKNADGDSKMTAETKKKIADAFGESVSVGGVAAIAEVVTAAAAAGIDGDQQPPAPDPKKQDEAAAWSTTVIATTTSTNKVATKGTMIKKETATDMGAPATSSSGVAGAGASDAGASQIKNKTNSVKKDITTSKDKSSAGASALKQQSQKNVTKTMINKNISIPNNISIGNEISNKNDADPNLSSNAVKTNTITPHSSKGALATATAHKEKDNNNINAPAVSTLHSNDKSTTLRPSNSLVHTDPKISNADLTAPSTFVKKSGRNSVANFSTDNTHNTHTAGRGALSSSAREALLNGDSLQVGKVEGAQTAVQDSIGMGITRKGHVSSAAISNTVRGAGAEAGAVIAMELDLVPQVQIQHEDQYLTQQQQHLQQKLQSHHHQQQQPYNTTSSDPTEMYKAALKQRQDIKERLGKLERQIFELETSYVEETWSRGNVIKGWDALLKQQSNLPVTTGGVSAVAIASSNPLSTHSDVPGVTGSASTAVNGASGLKRKVRPVDRIFSNSSLTFFGSDDVKKASIFAGNASHSGVNVSHINDGTDDTLLGSAGTTAGTTAGAISGPKGASGGPGSRIYHRKKKKKGVRKSMNVSAV